MRDRIAAAAVVVALAGCGPSARPAPPPPPEPACRHDSQCPAGQQCASGACVPYEGGRGDPCYDHMDCALDLECRAGSCQEPAAP